MVKKYLRNPGRLISKKNILIGIECLLIGFIFAIGFVIHGIPHFCERRVFVQTGLLLAATLLFATIIRLVFYKHLRSRFYSLQWKKLIFIFISFVLWVRIYEINPSIPPLPIIKNTLEIVSLDKKITESNDSDFKILEIRLNRNIVPFNVLEYDNEWKDLNGELVATGAGRIKYEFLARSGDKIEILSVASSQSGPILVRINGYEEVFDLYSGFEKGDQTVNVIVVKYNLLYKWQFLWFVLLYGSDVLALSMLIFTLIAIIRNAYQCLVQMIYQEKFYKIILKWSSMILVLMGILLLSFALIKTFSTNFTQINYFKWIYAAGFGLIIILLGIDYRLFLKKEHSVDEFVFILTSFLIIFVSIVLIILNTLEKLMVSEWGISTVGTEGIFLYSIFTLAIGLITRYVPVVRKSLITHLGIRRTIFGGLLLGPIITLAFFSDVFRGSLVTFIVFLLIGLGPTILLLRSYRRADIIFAISPTFGFCLINLIGSWLVRFDLPVALWARVFTFTGILFSLILCLKIFSKNSSEIEKVRWKGSETVLGGFGFVLLMAIIPVVIGGLKFSVLRGNPDDANNYLAMAELLNRIPMSMIRTANFQWLFEQNPIFPWAANITYGSRWAASMLLVYAANAAGISAYRFDLAFSAICYVLLFGPTLLLAKSIKIKPISGFLLASAIALGFYAQLVMDIRAFSEVISFPISVLLILLVSLIGEDTAIISWKLPKNWNVYLFMSLCLTALVLAYVEVLTFYIFGVFLFVIYILIRQRGNLWKIFWIMISLILGLGFGFLTRPTLINYFISQTTFGAIQALPWDGAFFQWLFKDSLAGPFGLSPFHNNVLTQLVMTIFGCILLVSLILSIIKYLFFVKKPNYGALLSIFLALTGIGVFGLLYFLGKKWQAGKAFTFTYPFLMVSLALFESPFPEIQSIKLKNFLSVVQKILNGIILTWLISQALLGFFRIGVAGWGLEYPFYISQGNDPSTYDQKYNWDLDPILKIINSSDAPLVWINGNNIHIDEFLSVAFDPSIRLMPVSMISGWIPLYDLVKPAPEWPDYLLIQKHKLPILDDGSLKEHIAYLDKYDNGFALIKIPQAAQGQLWLVGIQGAENSWLNLATFDSMGRPGFENLIKNAPIGLQFLSGEDGKVIVNSEIISNTEGSSIDAKIDCSIPTGNPCEVFTVGNNIEMRFNARKGYNYLLVKSDQQISFWLQNISIQTN